jgi:hypothetical protein
MLAMNAVDQPMGSMQQKLPPIYQGHSPASSPGIMRGLARPPTQAVLPNSNVCLDGRMTLISLSRFLRKFQIDIPTI